MDYPSGRYMAVVFMLASAVVWVMTALLSYFVAHRPEPVIAGGIVFGFALMLSVVVFIIDR